MLPFTAARRALFGGVSIMGAATSKTEADFKAHIAALPGSPLVWGTTGTDWYAGIGLRKGVATAAAAAGAMTGTSYMNLFQSGAAAPCRVIQHGLPSQAVFNDMVSRGAQIYVDVEYNSGQTSIAGLTRNGYTSAGYSGAEILAMRCKRLLYWYQDQAWEVFPHAGTAAVPFVIP